MLHVSIFNPEDRRNWWPILAATRSPDHALANRPGPRRRPTGASLRRRTRSRIERRGTGTPSAPPGRNSGSATRPKSDRRRPRGPSLKPWTMFDVFPNSSSGPASCRSSTGDSSRRSPPSSAPAGSAPIPSGDTSPSSGKRSAGVTASGWSAQSPHSKCPAPPRR